MPYRSSFSSLAIPAFPSWETGADGLAAAAPLSLPSGAHRESEERFRGAFEHAAIGMALVGLDGRWLQVNPSLCAIVGYREQELLATTFQSITHPDDLKADLEFVHQLMTGLIPSYRMVKRYFHKSGRVVWVVLSVSLVRDVNGQPSHFVSQVQDVTETRRREWLEADHRQILELVAQDWPLDPTLDRIAAMLERQVEGSLASIFLVAEGGIRQVAPNLPGEFFEALQLRALTVASGLANGGQTLRISRMADDLIWQSFRDISQRHGLRVCWATVIRAGDGMPHGLITLYCKQDRAPAANDLESMETAANLATIAIEHHAAASRLSHLTQHDALTGLPNRLLLQDRLEQALALARRSGRHVGLLAIDLDDFKCVNDTLGHQAGDHLLQLFAQRLRDHLREVDTLARTGGDEFTAILPELPEPDVASAVARKLVECLQKPFDLPGQQVRATASIGIAACPRDGENPARLAEAADAALYRAKNSGRNGHSF